MLQAAEITTGSHSQASNLPSTAEIQKLLRMEKRAKKLAKRQKQMERAMLETLDREPDEDRPRQSHKALLPNNDSSQIMTDNTRSYRDLDDRKRSSSRLGDSSTR